jgi:ubiquinone/menaquinone biosynthesis C-methylase UbiE
MKRETTNRIRFVLEELIPPVIRDSAPMRWLFRLYWGSLVDDLEHFRTNIHRVSDKEYEDIYARLPRIQEETDNSTACLERIADDVLPGNVLDVGCGTGFLIGHLQKEAVGGATYTGVDIIIDNETRERYASATFQEARVEALPYADNAFDTVICTHVLEHILDIRSAIAELRRVCANRLIIVVPRERETSFTFNPHIQFFPYEHSFLRQMIPVPKDAVLDRVGRDIYYREELR